MVSVMGSAALSATLLWLGGQVFHRQVSSSGQAADFLVLNTFLCSAAEEGCPLLSAQIF